MCIFLILWCKQQVNLTWMLLHLKLQITACWGSPILHLFNWITKTQITSKATQIFDLKCSGIGFEFAILIVIPISKNFVFENYLLEWLELSHMCQSLSTILCEFCRLCCLFLEIKCWTWLFKLFFAVICFVKAFIAIISTSELKLCVLLIESHLVATTNIYD